MDRTRPFRIEQLAINCEYQKYSKFFKNKYMIRVSSVVGKTTGYYKFVNISDQIALNKAAGWSDKKNMYRLEKPILK